MIGKHLGQQKLHVQNLKRKAEALEAKAARKAAAKAAARAAGKAAAKAAGRR